MTALFVLFAMLHVSECALLAWLLLRVAREPQSTRIGISVPTVASATAETTAPKTLILLNADGTVQAEVSSSATQFPTFPRDYEYGGTVYRLVVCNDRDAQYRAVVGPQSRRTVMRAH